MRGRQRMNAALLERLLHVAEFREQAARHDLWLAFFADAVAHLVEAVVDEIELEVVVIDARGIQAEDAHLAKLERDAARAAEVAAALGENGAHLRDRARGIVSGRLDDDGDAMRRVAFIDDLFVAGGVLARGALDRCLDLVLGHVEVAAVLNRAPQCGIGIRIRSSGLDGHVDVFRDARELLGHAVPAREHRVLSYFEDASHRARSLRYSGDCCYLTSRTGMVTLHTSVCPAGTRYHASRRLRRDSTYCVNNGVSVRSTSMLLRSASGTSEASRMALMAVRCSGFS